MSWWTVEFEKYLISTHCFSYLLSFSLFLSRSHSGPSPRVPDYTLIHKVSIRQTHTRTRLHTYKTLIQVEQCGRDFFPPSLPIQGCFYGNKLQFLALKSGNLQEVWAASRGRARGCLEEWVCGWGRFYEEDAPRFSWWPQSLAIIQPPLFFQAFNSTSLVLSVYPSCWLALCIQLN